MKHLLLVLLLISSSLKAQKNEYIKKEMHKFNFQPNCIAINKDNTRLLVGGENEKVIVYNLEAYKIIEEIDAHYQPVANVKFSNLHNGFYSVGDRSFKLWLYDEENPQRVYTGSHTNITDWATTPEEDFFVGGSYEKKFRIWNSSELDKPISISTSQKKSVISVAVTNDKKTIAAGSLDSTIELWDVNTQTRIVKILAHSKPVGCLNFIENGKYLLSASHDGYAKLWDAKTGDNLKVYTSQGQSINTISISANGKFLLAGTWDGFICLFAIPTGDLIYKFTHHKAPVWDVTWNNSDDGFYSCDKDGELVEWIVPKQLFADFYFTKELNKEMANNKLFKPRRKEESKDSYKARQQKAIKFKQELIEKYYQLALDKMVF